MRAWRSSDSSPRLEIRTLLGSNSPIISLAALIEEIHRSMRERTSSFDSTKGANRECSLSDKSPNKVELTVITLWRWKMKDSGQTKKGDRWRERSRTETVWNQIPPKWASMEWRNESPRGWLSNSQQSGSRARADRVGSRGRSADSEESGHWCMKYINETD